MRIAVEITGWDAVAKKLGATIELLVDSAKAVAVADGCELIELAQHDVPVLTGALKNSAYVSEPVMGDNKITVEAGYAATYAAARHETSSAGKGWLISASSVYGAQFPERFAGAMRSALAGGSVPIRFITSTPRPERISTKKAWAKKSGWTRKAIKTRGTAMRRMSRG